MEIKFKRKLSEFKYLVMFDLASKITGVCLWDVQSARPIRTDVLKVSGKTELPAAELDGLIDGYFAELNKMGISSDQILVAKEAMPTQLRGGSSTVQTFLALARSHAILDRYLYSNGIATYDYVGVYPISTHSYLKKIRGWESDRPIGKTDIREYVSERYGLDALSLDESDAVFLAQTLVEVKWDNDVRERIREVKRHMKELKAEHAKQACLDEIGELSELLTIRKGE